MGTQTFDVFDQGINGVCLSDGLFGLGRTLPELSNTECLGSRRSLSFTNVLDKVSDVLSLIVQRDSLPSERKTYGDVLDSVKSEPVGSGLL